jgi:hypothetical protein
MGGGGLNMGYVIYEGPSLLSGNPIVAIAIPESRNTKAGGLLQVFVMCQDTPPLEALKSGADADVCGDCVARPIDGDFCYVVVAQSVNMVWKNYKQLPVIHKGKHTGNYFKGYSKALSPKEITEVLLVRYRRRRVRVTVPFLCVPKKILSLRIPPSVPPISCTTARCWRIVVPVWDAVA